MHDLAKPPRLQLGMTIGVVAPSSPLAPTDDVDHDITALQVLGFNVVLGDHVYDQRGYLAGQDADRAEDFVAMFERPDVDAIHCLGGGYGANRTALALDLERLRRVRTYRPKAFIGYSDITVMHAIVQRELGWTTFYGPMLRGWTAKPESSRTAWRAALIDGEAPTVRAMPDGIPLDTVRGGRAEGRVLGGCLSLVVTLVGTPWELDFRDAIVLLEDVGEEPYRIDRMLAHLRLSGKLDGFAGFVVGELARCEADNPERSLALGEVFRDLLAPLGVPVLYGLPLGHGTHLTTVPLGARAELDADQGYLRFMEPGVE